MQEEAKRLSREVVHLEEQQLAGRNSVQESMPNQALTSKRKRPETLKFEPWSKPQDLDRGKISFLREAMSGSSLPNLVGQWLAEIDVATSKDDLDHSGFALDSNQTEFETLDSAIVNGIVKIIPHGFMRRIDLLDEKQYKDKRTMLIGRHIMFQIFSFFDINKNTEAHNGIDGFAQQ